MAESPVVYPVSIDSSGAQRGVQGALRAFDKLDAAFEKTQKSAAGVGSTSTKSIGELSSSIGSLPGPLGRAAQGVSGLSGSVGGLASGAGLAITAVGALAAGVVALGGAAVKMAHDTTQANDRIIKLAEVTGLAATELSRYQQLAEKALPSGSIDKIAEGFQKLSKAQADAERGSTSMQEALSTLGVRGETSSDLLASLADGFTRLGNTSERSAALTQLLGDGLARELAPALALGREGIEGLLAENDSMNRTLSGESVTATGEYQDAVQELGARLDGFSQTITTLVLPSMTSFVRLAGDIVSILPGAGQEVDTLGAKVAELAQQMGTDSALAQEVYARAAQERINTDRALVEVAREHLAIEAQVAEAARNSADSYAGLGAGLDSLAGRYVAFNGVFYDLTTQSDEYNAALDRQAASLRAAEKAEADYLRALQQRSSASVRAMGEASREAQAQASEAISGLAGASTEAMGAQADEFLMNTDIMGTSHDELLAGWEADSAEYYAAESARMAAHLAEYDQMQREKAASMVSTIAQLSGAISGLLEDTIIAQREADLEATVSQEEASIAALEAQEAANLKRLKADKKATKAEIKAAEQASKAKIKLAKEESKAKIGLAEGALRRGTALLDAAFLAQQGAALAQIGIDTATAITKAIAMFGPPPSPAGIAGIAAAGIIGAASAASVISQTVGHFSQPSVPSGGGSGTSASTPAANTTAGQGARTDPRRTGGGAGADDSFGDTPPGGVVARPGYDTFRFAHGDQVTAVQTQGQSFDSSPIVGELQQGRFGQQRLLDAILEQNRLLSEALQGSSDISMRPV